MLIGFSYALNHKANVLHICFGLMFLFGLVATANAQTDAEIAQEITKEQNSRIIDLFLKYELKEVNQYAVLPLLNAHPSLDFFIKQADRSPLNALFFLEEQVHKLRQAQENINSMPYLIAFTPSEKKIILSLKKVAIRIESYGIPLMKRDFYKVLIAIKTLAKKKGHNPMTLIPNPEFRDEVYRYAAPSKTVLDKAMGELSYGESLSMHLGWNLERVTLTRLWMIFNDNKLPKPDDYKIFRKKRSEYWNKRLARIYQEKK